MEGVTSTMTDSQPDRSLVIETDFEPELIQIGDGFRVYENKPTNPADIKWYTIRLDRPTLGTLRSALMFRSDNMVISDIEIDPEETIWIDVMP